MTTTTYAATRPIMTAAELRTHQATQYGRNYAESDDGYSDMEAEQGRGWHAVSGWGRDGWDLGSWPYVVIYTGQYERQEAGKTRPVYLLMQIVEGDRTVWTFDSEADRHAAIDYLFLWYAAGNHWAPITCDQREMLDIGYPLAIGDKWRGPYREGR